MDFGDTPADATFRAEGLAWLEATAEPRWQRPMGVLAESDGAAQTEHVRAATAWQATLEDSGWPGIAWLVEHGGRGGTSRQQGMFAEKQSILGLPHEREKMRA